MSSTANPTHSHILVISDSDRLSRAVKVNLERRFGAQIVSVSGHAGRAHDSHDLENCDLIVVALGSSTSEPLVVLAKAALASRVGQIPLLIISDRPFEPDPEYHILHLDFPFDADQLYDAVNKILRRESAAC